MLTSQEYGIIVSSVQIIKMVRRSRQIYEDQFIIVDLSKLTANPPSPHFGNKIRDSLQKK